MLETEAALNAFLVQYCRMLVADIPEERMVEQPLPDVNHPAWILGHLAWSTDRVLQVLGAEPALPAEWATRFGVGSKPAPAREAYPSKEELMRTLESGFERARRLATEARPEQLAQPSTNPRFKDALPTAQHVTALLLTGHMGIHLGQLTMWRRMTGTAPLF